MATLIVCGDCDHEAIVRIAAEAFAGWRGAGDAGPIDQEVALRPGPLHIVPRAGAPQSELRIGHVAASRETPDYHALVAANMVLGGQFVSRINLNLREDKGLTYGARTAFDFRRMPGPFALQVSVQTAGTVRAIAESLDEIAAIRGPRPITEEELALGVAALTRGSHAPPCRSRFTTCRTTISRNTSRVWRRSPPPKPPPPPPAISIPAAS
jgi:predicted Zn-dependent peptidase